MVVTCPGVEALLRGRTVLPLQHEDDLRHGYLLPTWKRPSCDFNEPSRVPGLGQSIDGG
jgi:hypothetical protein